MWIVGAKIGDRMVRHVRCVYDVLRSSCNNQKMSENVNGV